MGAFLIIIGIIAVVVIIIALAGLRIVRQAECMVIELLGRYRRTAYSGITVIWPIIERAREIYFRYVTTDVDSKRSYITVRKGERIDLRETVYDFPGQDVITKDNVVVKIDALLYFQIIDPVKSIYEISNLPNAIEKLTQTALRNVIGEMTLDDTLSSRDVINRKLRSILDEATDKWGVKVHRVELQDINPPADIRDALEKQMRAERDRRATILQAEGIKQAKILEAEGIKTSEINKAEGEKQAKILVAEGEAQAINKVTEAIAESKGDPATYLIAVRYIEALKEMVSGKDNKVIYLPYEATGILSSIGGIKDMLTGTKKSG